MNSEKKRILSVSDLTLLIQKVLDNVPQLSGLWVRGEISNFKKHTTGHLYFSLKDEYSSIRAVMFKGRAASLTALPADGMDCLVRGYVSLYPRDTQVQLYAEEIIPAGVGILQIALEELKKKLWAKGYFDEKRKRPLPFLPRGIGIVTSSVGAAIRDIGNVVNRRFPGMPIILYPALVQGEKAARTVADGIRALGTVEQVDVIIVARGGGSVEDLNVFNTEEVADAVFLSPKPVVSAIGHEIDFTITDLVADMRAATPSAAGEMVVPVRAELAGILKKYGERLHNSQMSRLEREKMRMGYLVGPSFLERPERWLRLYQEGLAREEVKLFEQAKLFYEKKVKDIQTLGEKLHALSPLATMARGYSICKDKNGKIINSADKVQVDDMVEVTLYSGVLGCIVKKKEDY